MRGTRWDAGFRIISTLRAFIEKGEPFIPPPEKVLGVEKAMDELGIRLKYVQLRFPENFRTVEEALSTISEFTKSPFIRLDST